MVDGTRRAPTGTLWDAEVIAATIGRLVLGFLFTLGGVNGVFPFLHHDPPSTPAARQYMEVVTATHYLSVVFVVQLLCGVLLLANRFVPLALILVGGVIFNVWLYHLTMDPAGLTGAVVVSAAWLATAWRHRASFYFLARPKLG